MFLSASLFALGRGEDRPLRYALSGDPDTLDPHKTDGTLTFQVVKSVYDTLAEPDETGRDRSRPRRKLDRLGGRQGLDLPCCAGTVVFPDGTPFTSKDVKATLLRILDKRSPLRAPRN
jgi:peptide/nickel transport system substrate-binding protein